MEKKVPLVASRGGKKVVIGEVLVSYDSKDSGEVPKVIETTLYSDEVLRQIQAASVRDLSIYED